MDSYGIFHADTHLRTPKSQFWTPNGMIFIKKHDFPKNIPDFPETIPAYLNFVAAQISFPYLKKLSYSSRSAYIKNKSAGAWKKPTCLLKNVRKRLQTHDLFVMCRPFSELLIP